eukprot:358582-Chlamydomonas_euryale.AAC.11
MRLKTPAYLVVVPAGQDVADAFLCLSEALQLLLTDALLRRVLADGVDLQLVAARTHCHVLANLDSTATASCAVFATAPMHRQLDVSRAVKPRIALRQAGHAARHGLLG